MVMYQPSAKDTLSRETSRKLIQMVQNGQWQPGEKIPGELELAAQFGVSRNIMREALKSMAILGILESRHGSGTYVSARPTAGIAVYRLYHQVASEEDIGYRLQARLIVEPGLAALAAKQADPEEIKEILTLADSDDQGDDYRPGTGYRFHMAVARASGNPLLIGLVETLLNQQYDEEFMDHASSLTKEQLQALYQEHHEVAMCIAAGDATGAAKAMQQHLERGAVFLR